jgi:hypothetical protein
MKKRECLQENYPEEGKKWNKSFYIINNVIDGNVKICRYMNFDKFLTILDGKFYVPRKQLFLDVRESGRINMKYRFVPCIVGENANETDDAIRKRQEEQDGYIDSLKKSRFLLTSCWARYDEEDYLMWRGYTEGVGVCVCTTINKLIDSVNFSQEEYLPVVSPMFYAKTDGWNKDFLESMLTKDEYYKSENEIRFYFVPLEDLEEKNIRNIGNVELERMLLEAAQKEESLYNTNPKSYMMSKIFSINPDFIDSVILSPNISNASVEIFQNIIKERCRDNVKIFKSRIRLS